VLAPALAQVDLASELTRWPVLAAAGALVVILGGFALREDLAAAMGLETPDVALLTVGSVAAPVLSVPVAVVEDAVFAVNLGGAIVPALVTLRLHAADRVPLGRLALAGALVAAATWAVVTVDPGRGVVAEAPAFLVPGAVALVAGLALTKGEVTRAGPLAFAAGSLGALVGADLLALPQLLGAVDQVRPGGALVLGGAGAFDLVFLSGALGLAAAVVLGLVVRPAPEAPPADPGAPPRRVPDPGRVLREAEARSGLSPREACLVELARANRALERPAPGEAVTHAHRAAGALLDAGQPRLLDRVAEAGPDEVQAWMRELTATRKEATRAPPAWHEAADAVELAKHLSGALWEQAPGRVRLEGVRP